MEYYGKYTGKEMDALFDKAKEAYTKEEVDALIASCVPLSRDFNDDFNNDFAI